MMHDASAFHEHKVGQRGSTQSGASQPDPRTGMTYRLTYTDRLTNPVTDDGVLAN